MREWVRAYSIGTGTGRIVNPAAVVNKKGV